MKKILILIAALCAAGALAQSDDNPGSLWNDHARNPMTLRTAHSVGDILTVVVSESTTANFSATTSTSKADKTTIATPNIPLLGSLIGNLGYGANSATSGSGTTQQANNLTATLTVVVKQVMANGNLLIEGVRRVTVNKDVQLVRLTGVVRPDDIASDNSILSSRIANAEIKTEGKGQIADRQRQGFITKLLSFLF